jgi:hypothetical protein
VGLGFLVVVLAVLVAQEAVVLAQILVEEMLELLI